MIALRRRHALILALLATEMLAAVVAFQWMLDFECRDLAAMGACRAIASMVGRTAALVAVFGLFIWARPDNFRICLARSHPTPQIWIGLHLLGVAAIFFPLPILLQNGTDAFALALGPWLFGMVAAGAGALFWFAPPSAWREWIRAERYLPLAVGALALALPDITFLVQPLWEWQALTQMTFSAVANLLLLIRPDAFADPSEYVIGTGDFFVMIAQPCSGVEGLALVTGFLGIYALLFRNDLRQGRFWLTVLPVALALSWSLNVVRIAALVLIGAHVSPELAVNGFHSHAGWMFFTILALALLAVVQRVGWLHQVVLNDPGAPPLAENWLAARILPFVVFMLSGVVVSAFAEQPGLAYPVKALALLAALMFFWKPLARIEWRIDPVAVAAGVAIGLAWIATQPAPESAEAELAGALAGLGALALAVWIVARVVGHVVLVPVVEELFFRGYLMARLDMGGPAGRALAIAVSSAAFAALHGRWLAAFLAGVVFALVMLRRGRLSDAVIAHALANATIAAWACIEGDWARI